MTYKYPLGVAVWLGLNWGVGTIVGVHLEENCGLIREEYEVRFRDGMANVTRQEIDRCNRPVVPYVSPHYFAD